MLRSARSKECDGAMLVLELFDLVAAFSSCAWMSLCRQLRWINESLTRAMESTRNGFASLTSHSHQAASPPRRTGRHHPGSTQDHPGSRERRAALTLGWKGVRPGQIFVTLADDV